MDKVISLLTSLFNLTKVASVTLPGLLAAGGLALVLWPPLPIERIPAVVQITPPCSILAIACNGSNPTSSVVPSPFPQAFQSACTVESFIMDDAVNRMLFGQLAPKSLGQEVARDPRLKDPSVPEITKRHIREQFVLDVEAQELGQCINLEKSWQGQEEREIQQANTDITNLEAQRSAAQTSLLVYEKSNNAELVQHYEYEMRGLKGQIDSARGRIASENLDLQERVRRLAELSEDQKVIQDRLADPGRLRPRVGFDVFATGLINHVVAFILLSLAAGVVVTAIDRAGLNAIFEDVFDGF